MIRHIARRQSRQRRILGLFCVLTLILAACSVSVPRNGFTDAAREGTSPGVAPGSAGEAGDAGSAGTAPEGSVGNRERALDGPASPGTKRGAAPSTSAAPSAAPPSDQPGPVVGVADDTITISLLAGFSGTFGVVLREAVKGFDVWADDVNSRGGIHGRQVVVKKVDHKETAEGGVAACKEVLNNGSFTAIIAEGQGDANVTGAHCLDDAGFVHLAVLPAIDPDLTTAYTILPATTDQGSSLASFVKNVMGDGERKIGVIHLKPPAYVQGKDAFVNEARKLGMDVVAQEAIEENQASFTPQLIRIRDAGAETVAIIATYEAAGILRDAKAIGYEPHWTGIVWLFDFVSQASGGTASGARGLRFSATIDSPVYGEFQATAAKQGRSGLTDGEALINYGYGLLMGRVLEAAGPQPTLETLRSGIEAINNYFNGVLPPITWGPGDPVGPTASFPAVCCGPDNTWKSLGPPKDRF